MKWGMAGDMAAESIRLRKITETIASALGETGTVGPFWLTDERLHDAESLIRSRRQAERMADDGK